MRPPAAERSPGRRSSSRTRCAPKRTGRFLRRKSGGAFPSACRFRNGCAPTPERPAATRFRRITRFWKRKRRIHRRSTGSLNTIPTFKTSSPITRAEALRKRLPAGSTEKASAGRTATSEPTLKRWMKMEPQEAANDSVFFRDRELQVRGDQARAGRRAGDAVDCGLHAGRPVCV